MKQTWLGIDPGLAIIGWAILEGEEGEIPTLIDYGMIETDKSLSTSERLVEIERDMMELIQDFQPSQVAIEMPFFSRQIKAAGGVLQALGVINLVIFREIQQTPVMLHQASWKCHLGDGRATKKDVATMVQTLFDLESLPIDDSVDAIAIAYSAFCGLRNNIG
ncbi:MAG TPA: crossover junction endodeoxyribonuclease RuvC [Cyanothece sp. UBA12306]|nr:crossover junction endodeoxyribonuclease RuvC [Cyanothece sp. UBA12306]